MPEKGALKKMSNPVHFEKTLSSETLFEGRVITLTKDGVESSDYVTVYFGAAE